ncbi:MAG: DUF4097 domain-containing protein [Melioribacteraceae bacterium]|nr:DUF4097 domain-containing protein [Melioribacteraceae bacterium]
MKGKTTLFVILILLVSVLKIQAEELKVIKTESYSVQKWQSLYVNVPGADVKVVTTNSNEARLTVYGNSKAEEKLTITMEQTSKGLKLVIKRKGSFNWFNFGRGIKVKVKAEIPNQFNAYIETSGGDILLSKLTGNIKLETSGGDIITSDTESNMICETSGGDIEVTNSKGDADLGTSGGDIKAKNIIGKLRADTSGGDITIETKDGSINAETSGGDIDIKYYGKIDGINAETSGGDINISVPKDANADVDLDSSGGDVSVSHSKSSNTRIKRGEFQGKLNSGGAKISGSTSGGDITLTEN